MDFADNGMQTCEDLQSRTLFVDRLPKGFVDDEIIRDKFSTCGIVNFCQVGRVSISRCVHSSLCGCLWLLAGGSDCQRCVARVCVCRHEHVAGSGAGSGTLQRSRAVWPRDASVIRHALSTRCLHPTTQELHQYTIREPLSLLLLLRSYLFLLSLLLLSLSLVFLSLSSLLLLLSHSSLSLVPYVVTIDR